MNGTHLVEIVASQGLLRNPRVPKNVKNPGDDEPASWEGGAWENIDTR